ncbi:ATP-dependent Clp protease ATP-binding subunit [Xanthovirga aplysinae]|uniref:ATP-dependent Clp protease ATP-binding subunit n=1 Tax=Xanthovirga aplysinae TaxID=2529853 RepID=UPI0012BBD5EE|nr:ATP-dependent Clp protease ATP-binding subunit [Xanthovirga aplysinae]MTI31846.1 ATP-dependent Clp protease ATP-binding subunit [Xanthovirga aplysinae]
MNQTVLKNSPEIEKAIYIAQQIALDNSNAYCAPPHLFKALFHKDLSLEEMLLDLDKDIYYIEEWAEVKIEDVKKGSSHPEKLKENPALDAVKREAEAISFSLQKDQVDMPSILAALCTPGVGFSYDELKSLPLSRNEILNITEQPTQKKGSSRKTHPQQSQKALAKYCRNKTKLAKDGQLQSVIGREYELRRIFEVLGRKIKPNVILIGNPGVGKSAVLDSLSMEIAQLNVPERLQKAAVFELDHGALFAGASYKGEVEDRLKAILEELKTHDKAILFIDEIHTLLNKKNGNHNLTNLLKPELEQGEITLIGATTTDEYVKHIENEEGFSRRFELLKIEEPSTDLAYRMIRHIKSSYEDFHQLKVKDDVVKEAIRLANRYMKGKSLPDSAIDLLDRTLSVVKTTKETANIELKKFNIELKELCEELQGEELHIELLWLQQRIEEKVGLILYDDLKDKAEQKSSQSMEQIGKSITEKLQSLEEVSKRTLKEITKTHLSAVVAQITGIPMGKIRDKEKERLINMETIMRKRVVGQDHALKAVSEAVVESRSGLSKGNQPIGSFFLLGPTGTGKTELAKTLAEFLFQDEEAIIRFDMSEFKEEHSASLLYGAPPGYVGYEEGGLLVNKIRQKPYSVVLFDEIEKAHHSVFDLFLQIMDEGKLHDKLGKEGDFSNAVVLFTSNIGSQYITESFQNEHLPTSSNLLEIMSQYFRPEFLGRLTEIVPFAPIREENIVDIFDIHLRKELTQMLDEMDIELQITEEAKKHLALSGYNAQYGARPIKNIIRTQLRKPLSKRIICGALKKGEKITVGWAESTLIWKQ